MSNGGEAVPPIHSILFLDYSVLGLTLEPAKLMEQVCVCVSECINKVSCDTQEVDLSHCQLSVGKALKDNPPLIFLGSQGR